MLNLKIGLSTILVILLLLPFGHSRSVLGAEFPSKPITLIVPSGAGGGHDLTFRAVTSVSMDYLGQPMVVRLMPGGGGAIGSDFVAKAKPDGYTLLAGGRGWSSALPAVDGRSKGPDDLATVCRVNYNTIMLVARGDGPYKNFKELMAWVKANPGKLIVGTGSRWIQADHFWKKLMLERGIKVKLVPYQGGGQQFRAVLGGHSDVGGAIPAMYDSFKGTGKLTPLIWLDKKRHPHYPNVPTSYEEGGDFMSGMWRGILAPKGTPRPIIEKLGAACRKMTKSKTVVRMIKRFGDGIQFLGPDEFAKVWRAEYEELKTFGRAFKKAYMK